MRIKLLVSVLAVVFVVAGWTTLAHADGSLFNNFRTGNDITVPEGQTVDASLFAAGNTIDIAGTVNGDVYCAGQSITITGHVSGDVMCAGQSVRLAGVIDGDIRIAGQTVSIGGVTASNATVAGQSVTLDASGRIQGDASIASQNATVNGAVGRDLAAAGTRVTVNGAVGRDISAGVTSLTLGSNSAVGGNVSYVSRHDATLETGAHVAGTLSRQEPPANQDNGPQLGAMIGGGIAMAVYWFVAFMLISLVLVLLFPRFVHDATEVAVNAPWKTLLVGFLGSFIGPIAIVTLMLTVIGIPLALLFLLGWALIVCLSVPFAAYCLGSLLISKSTTNPVWIMLLGSAIVLVLFMIPLVGFITWLVAMWFGLGIILQQVRRVPRPRYSTK